MKLLKTLYSLEDNLIEQMKVNIDNDVKNYIAFNVRVDVSLIMTRNYILPMLGRY